MDWKTFWVTFTTIFLAEMGDKTQLAALVMAAETRLPLAVFSGACTALVLATLLGVVFGSQVAHWLPPALLKKAAGLAFVLMGGLILMGKM
jgi:putative Ca2+/H+ antiporter (TMEM165/GDT1 family)